MLYFPFDLLRKNNKAMLRLKAPLVANGYSKIFGRDYCDTLSPLAKITFVHLSLSMTTVDH